MSERDDRRLQGTGNLLVAAVMLLILGVSGFIFWWKLSARVPPGPAAVPEQRSAAVVPSGDEPMSLTVYLPVNDALSPYAQQARREPDAQSQAREIASVLLGQAQGKGHVLPNLKLRELYLDEAGTAYLDLSIVPREGLRSSAGEELLAFYALTNSIMQNVEEVKRVRFLIDGRSAATASGHLDLSRSYVRRMDLVRQ